MAEIGLPPVTQGIYTAATGENNTARNTVLFGTRFEDTAFAVGAVERVFNHFFDPQFNNFAGRGLQKGGVTIGHPSPDWALEDRGELGALVQPAAYPQNYSFRQGQQYFFAALTGATAIDRQLAFGRMFESLGHVVHHLQDMAQPQHVRNDGHTHFNGGPDLVDWAAFERHTERYVNGQILTILSANPYTPGIPQFPTARQFWHTPGATSAQYTGMAEFTAQNYPSYGTQFEAYRSADGKLKARSASGFPLPSGNDVTGAEKRVVTEFVQVNLKSGVTRGGDVEFLKGSVFDQLGGSTDQRLALSSLVNRPQRSGAGIPKPVFKEDPAVFNDMYRVLFPRAVAFSAGLINHFFRGRLSLVRSTTSNALLVGNMGQQAMNGNFFIYYEDAAGTRRSIPNASAKTSLLPGASFTISGFTEPVGATKLIVAFQGQIGSEGDPTTNSGWYAVAGKVIDYNPPPAQCPGTRVIAQKFDIYKTINDFNGVPIGTIYQAGLSRKDNDLELGPVVGTVTVKIEASPMIATIYTAPYEYTFQRKSIDVRAYTTTPESNENFYFKKTLYGNVNPQNGIYSTINTTETFVHNPAPPRRSVVRFYISGETSTYQVVPTIKLTISCPGKPL